MNTFDLTLHAADEHELADQLRHVADRIDRLGPPALPCAGEEKPVLIDGQTAGAISQPGCVTFVDQAYLDRAALVGDTSLMRRISDAQSAITSLLQDDLNGLRELSDYHRHGLLLAMQELSASLEERAGFLDERMQEAE